MQGLRVCARLASKLPLRQQGRLLSSSSAATKPSIQVQQERDRQDLNDFFPELMENFREILEPIKIPYETEWLVKAMEYNGRFLRWPGILNTYNTMRVLSPESSPDYLRKAKLLAWAVEIAHIVFLVTDDIADDGNMRWGKPVWWKLPEVGLNCVNDAFLMEGVMYQILKREFGDNRHYVQLFELFTHVRRR
ncbi:hypothetical protein ONE63_000169 [Megalurothrips usitatus]|uniref:Farnesyl pyrophosphate synthase-like n=1 Tax=Megalurothrips usitatus TaxID=439358 RepID=A0AAV7XXM3_9NEOP|nr:hypothetical protein ONE63_000169 [Megalurothrips usitatus]